MSKLMTLPNSTPIDFFSDAIMGHGLVYRWDAFDLKMPQILMMGTDSP